MKFFLQVLLLGVLPFNVGADLAQPPPMEWGSSVEIRLSDSEAQAVGQRIWQNEGAGKIENLVVWNKGEDFPSLGIGHFIWYPAGVEAPFTESFPALLELLKKDAAVPLWLRELKDAPWASRDAFYRDINAWRMHELRELMRATMPQQVAFIVQRLQGALPKMLETLSTATARSHVEQQFYRVSQAPNGVYALIDYVNFKGEGISERERYHGEGWGLLQLLQAMPADANDTMAAFARAADAVLTRRVANAPRDESRWLVGWRKRIATYRAR